ncbi:hypothetical protein D5282_18710 [bacterium 1xD8-48]|nr:hypothetical protein [bacterium 1xD8-48]
MVSDGRYKVKRIWKKLYLGLAILGMFVPLQVNAEEQDTVTLQEENSKVAVSLGMSHAKEEKISTLSISLSVDMGGQNQGEVVFDFDSGLESVTEHDYIYNANTGIMDIYVSSLKNQSLFGDGELRLGHVRIEPADSSAVLQVEVGYCDGSFQTANASYGNKTPVISSLPDPVLLQIGAVTPSQPGGSSDSGSQGGGESGGQNSGGNAGHGNDNMSQGLYDEETRFTNNPADAQNISSTVVKENNLHPELVDMSKGSAAQIGNKTLAGSVGAGAGAAKGSGKVSVVAPKEGPDSIVVNGGAGGAAGEGGGAGGGAGGGEAGISGTYGEGSGTDGGSSLSGEIRLDKKNGGAVAEKDNAKMKWIIGGGVVAALVIAGIVIFILAGKRSRGRKHKKPVRRKKKRPDGKKRNMDGARAEHPAGKKKTVHKGSGNRRR